MGGTRQKIPVERPYGTPVTSLAGIGPAYAARLNRLGILNVADLLWHIPFRYLDRTQFVPIADCRLGEEVQLSAEVETARAYRGNFRAGLADGSGKITAVWFRQPYLQRAITPGCRLVVSGRVTDYGGRSLVVSDYELLDDDADTGSLLGAGRLVPVYGSTEGVSQRWLRTRVKAALEVITDGLAEYLSRPALKRLQLPSLPTAFGGIHFPNSWEEVEASRRRLALEEFLLREVQFQLLGRARRERLRSGTLESGRRTVERLKEGLGFLLSRSQKESLEEILGDLARPWPMYRLLQGEVGSGKSIVAYLAMTAAAAAGFQSCLLAPTELLARQHLERLSYLVTGTFPEPVLFTSGSSAGTADLVAGGRANLIVGTHALIHDRIDFADLALVVVDEQQRFGIAERSRLLAKGNRPHCLYLTATPIPRTFARVLHGDMDLSSLEPLPANLRKVTTRLVRPERRDDMIEFIRERLEKGERAFFICPRKGGRTVEDEGLVDVVGLAWELRRSLPPDWVEVLHGTMSPEEQLGVISRFRDGGLRCLCATSVVEVGLDVPEATCMVVENPDRFGLAQLHQMRGRIGRAGQSGYFFMMSPRGAGPRVEERLAVLCETDDGLEISTADLRYRGPGLTVGPAQHGWFPFKCADVTRDEALQAEAAKLAAAILRQDPELARPEHAGMRRAARGLQPISQLFIGLR